MQWLKSFSIKHGRKFLLTVLFLSSALLIAHFVTQYYYKASLIDKLFAPQALVVKPIAPPAPVINTEPKGGSAPKEKSTQPIDDDVKVEVFGLIKFEMGEANSWETIAKILTVILGTFFGIRAINAIFNRLDDEEPNPAK